MRSVSIFSHRLSFCILESFFKCWDFELVRSHFTFPYLYSCNCIPETITQANIQEHFFHIYMKYIYIEFYGVRSLVIFEWTLGSNAALLSIDIQFSRNHLLKTLLSHECSWNYYHGGFKGSCVFVSGIFILFHSSTCSKTGITQIWLLQLCSVEWNQKVCYLQPCSSNTILIGSIRQVCTCVLY